jgi:hypothetical protein
MKFLLKFNPKHYVSNEYDDSTRTYNRHYAHTSKVEGNFLLETSLISKKKNHVMGYMHGIKWVCIVVGGMHGIKYVERVVFTYFPFFCYLIVIGSAYRHGTLA